MKSTALLVIDVQQGLLDEHPFEADALLQNIKTLQDFARQNGTEVIFVRHHEDDPNGLFFGSPQWQIGAAIAPLEGETIIEKHYSSTFKDTELEAHLQKQNIQTLIVCGMQTEYCVDATVKSAFEHGYKVYIPKYGTTTFDASIAPADKLRRYYEEDIWDGRFADVIPLDEALKELK
ncbi:MAG TPA: cysteine hydrolase family protein [Candidatus Limiplasma sp.]|nr:cysteine hydrolase family protein [Candidatus Limiplasma sp.]HRX08363.1 cysteine hydrolase family protein [Candidatus Limiplasma sp.]